MPETIRDTSLHFTQFGYALIALSEEAATAINESMKQQGFDCEAFEREVQLPAPMTPILIIGAYAFQKRPICRPPRTPSITGTDHLPPARSARLSMPTEFAVPHSDTRRSRHSRLRIAIPQTVNLRLRIRYGVCEPVASIHAGFSSRDIPAGIRGVRLVKLGQNKTSI